ncbi:MAG: HIT family protein [Lactobacillales bacterium]|nr:HIT family protein [Lactobacillales bacterium]
MFQLHPNLQQKEFVCDLDFCRVLFENNKDCPWIFLVPRKNNVRNMLDLTSDERGLLSREIEICERAMNALFAPDQTNVAMIGNMTPQLHVHIICRFKTDPYWPGVVWGQPMAPYTNEAKNTLIQKIKKELTHV